MEWSGTKRAVNPLTQALNDKDEQVHKYAYLALQNLKIALLEKKRDVTSLIKALQDTDQEVRKRAVQALGRIGDHSAIESLKKALKDPSYFVGICAKEALEKIELRKEITDIVKHELEKIEKEQKGT